MVRTYGKFVSRNGEVVELGNTKLENFQSKFINKKHDKGLENA